VLEDLAAKVVVVAGGAGGLGAAQARLLHELGARVVVADLNGDRCAEIAAKLGEPAHPVAVDVADEGQWNALTESVLSHFGRIDSLVNTFGISPQGELATLDVRDYMRVVQVNQVGVFLGMKAVVPALREAGGGTIINIASGAGVSPMPRLFAYSATKAAVITMTKSAALELGADRIRVNCVLPGAFETALRAQTVSNWQQAGAAELENALSHIPIPRMGRPEELANLVAFLCSEASSYSTGAVFLSEGGALAGRTR
jgi:3alpha(or 20beta)-hydroxysteroid dehydrogenase